MYWTNYLGSFVRMEVHITLNWDIVEDRRLKFGKLDNLKIRPNCSSCHQFATRFTTHTRRTPDNVFFENTSKSIAEL
jgi:hypothetical protein